MRQLTPKEHAAVKGIPFELVAGEVNTFQHQMLGQSIAWPGFVAVGQHLGRQLIASLKRGVETVEGLLPNMEIGAEPVQLALF